MKILCCIAGLGSGGAERQLIYLLKGLKKYGHEPALLVFSKREKVKYKEIFDIDICCYFSAVESNKKTVGSAKILKDIKRLIKIENPELVYSCLDVANLFCRLAKIMGIISCPVISSIRNDFSRLYKNKNRYIEIILQLFGSGVITNHYPSSLLLRDKGLRNVFYIPNGIPAAGESVLDCVGTKKYRHKPVQIINVGRLRLDHKRQDLLINALALLKDVHNIPEFFCKIIGEGRDYKKLQAMINDFGLQNNVKLVGHVDNMREIYNRADILVHNSALEGCPNVVLEAMSNGVPVAAGHYVGQLKIVNHGITGIVAKGDGPEHLKNAIKQMIFLPDEQYARMSRTGIKMVKEKYSTSVMVESYISAFEKVVKLDQKIK